MKVIFLGNLEIYEFVLVCVYVVMYGIFRVINVLFVVVKVN